MTNHRVGFGGIGRVSNDPVLYVVVIIASYFIGHCDARARAHAVALLQKKSTKCSLLFPSPISHTDFDSSQLVSILNFAD